MKTAAGIALVAAACLANHAPGADLLVPQQFITIQEAINAAADGDRVLVSAGTYHEQVNLSGKGIHLIGVDGAAATAIDGDHIRTVIIGIGEPSTCLVKGLTIQRGFTNGLGGGVTIAQSSAVFEDCVFKDNRAGSGTLWGAAAWRSEYGAPQVRRCLFMRNESQISTSGIYHYLGGSISISDCLFVDNGSHHANPVRVQNEGGAINFSISHCFFRGSYNTGAIGSEPATWFYPVLLWSPYSGTISGTISDCTFDSPQVPFGMSTTRVAPVYFGGSGYQVTLSGNNACDYPTWSVQENGAPGSAWTDGGGNILKPNCCPSDLNDDGDVDGIDLGILLSDWGICPGCRSDLTGNGAVDGTVDGGDLGALLASWGPCP